MSKSQPTKFKKKSPRATYQDVLNAPPHKVAEIVDGKLYTNPRPASPHALAYSRLGSRISTAFDFGESGPGGWWILDEPELHLGEDIVVPDIAGWRRERMPDYPEAAYFKLAPDWVCEVLSPSTRKLDLGKKKAVYAREGVAYHWFVDPDARSLAAYVLRDAQWALIDKRYDDAVISLPPFEAIRFNLSDLWPPHIVHKGLPNQPTVRPEPKKVGVSK